MKKHERISEVQLRKLIKSKGIQFAGNSQLKIYGTLRCASGKRMKKGNRVFFNSVAEAIQNGFRPCGHCMRGTYLEWRADFKPQKH
jgi:methylphosphotriester-DNA--protein-cysteine methyltransferase